MTSGGAPLSAVPGRIPSRVVALEPWAPPDGWDRQSLFAFESALDAWLPSGSAKALGPENVHALAEALDLQSDVAVRAALILARSGDPAAGEALLAHLERRVERTDPQGGDAPDVVAAASFQGSTRARDAAVRLEALAASARPHPDLEVRVECARSALQLGRDAVIPFLLRVLREGTNAARGAPDWKRKPDVAWAQVRASDALSRRAGIPDGHRPEAALAERAAAADRLEQLLPKPKKKKR